MSKRIFLFLFSGMLMVVLAGCGGGGGRSALPGGGDASGQLTWDAPSSNTDGSPVADLAGYKLYYGTASGNYTASIDVGNVTSIPVTTLSSSVPVPGLYFIAVTAYDITGHESVYSDEISERL